MSVSDVGRRLLAALAGSTSAFTRVPRPVPSTPLGRFFAAVADSTPAFTPRAESGSHTVVTDSDALSSATFEPGSGARGGGTAMDTRIGLDREESPGPRSTQRSTGAGRGGKTVSAGVAVRARVEHRRRTVLLPVVGLVALGVSGLVLLGLGTGGTGWVPLLVGAFMALMPVVVVIGAFLWVDRWEPEPPRTLLLAFVWGACGATITSLAFNRTMHVLGEAISGDGATFVTVVGAPVVEEAAKVAFVVALLLRRRQEFDGVVDGVVYAGVTAAGFAFTENIWYFARAYSDSGFGDLGSGVVALFVLRGVLSPFAHPLFTTMAGIGVGIAAMTDNRKLRFAALTLGYLAAVGLHSLWNFSTKVATGATFVNLYFLIMVPVFASMVGVVVWQRSREQRIVAAQMQEMAARHWIAPSEVILLASLQGRRRWRRVVRRKVGEQAAKAVADYQAAAIELAFLRHRMAQGAARVDAGERHARLLAALIAARQAAVNAPGAMRAADGVRRG